MKSNDDNNAHRVSILSRLPFTKDVYESGGREFICGGGAAIINIIITFPPNKLMFRQQLYGLSMTKSYANMRQEGTRRLYRGVKPPLIQSMISKSLMFGCYTHLLSLFESHRVPEKIAGPLAAFFSGTVEAILTPFERTQTLLQIPKYNDKMKGAWDAARQVQRCGWKEHYRGLSAILLRNGPSNMVFFGLRDPVMKHLEPVQVVAGPFVRDFLGGALLGACLSTTFFPINVAKTRMQSELGVHYNMNVWEALQVVYKERGGSVRRVYRGVQINFTRSLVSWGIINSSYEALKKRL